MKAVTPVYKFTGTNGWGVVSTTNRQAFEVEPSDVGRVEPNYLGARHRDYKFTQTDVGRMVVRILDPLYPSWSFCPDEWIARHAK